MDQDGPIRGVGDLARVSEETTNVKNVIVYAND